MKLLCTGLLTLSLNLCSAQEIPASLQQQLEDQAARLQMEQEKETDHLDELAYFKEHPLNINTSSRGDLEQLQLLSASQINNLLAYRKLLGKLVDIHELQSVPGWDLITIEKVTPFLFAGPVLNIQQQLMDRFKQGSGRLSVAVSRVLEKSAGYDTAVAGHYYGDPYHLTTRFVYRNGGGLQYGFVADKDAGEPLQFRPGWQGFDFYSFHLFIKNLGHVKSLAIGDYTLSMGEGLIQWQSFALNRSAEIMAIKRQGPVLSPHASAGEFRFNRGVATTLVYKKVEATLFTSVRKLSAASAIDSSFSSFNTTGYHRSAAEIVNRNQVRVLELGQNTDLIFDRLRIGTSLVVQQLSQPLQPSAQPFNYFAPAGRSFSNAGIHFSGTFQNVYFFGEVASDKLSNLAWTAGMLSALDPKVDLAVLHRHISERYQSLFGNAFMESSRVQNEEGTYMGMNIRPAQRWLLSAYMDVFYFPWLRYRVNAPSHGSAYWTQLKFVPSKVSSISGLFQVSSHPLNASSDSLSMPQLYSQERKDLQIDVTSTALPLTWKSRVSLVWYHHVAGVTEKGFLAFMEMTRKAGNMSVKARLQYFDTDGYNSRVYVLQGGASSSVVTPSYYGRGLCFLLHGAFEWWKGTNLTATAARVVYQNGGSVGSGLDKITGHAKTMVTLEITRSFN